MSTIVASIVGFSLFFFSEILPLLPIPTNGIVDTFIRGFSNAFKSRPNNVQMARETVKNPNFANIVNTLSNNSVIKTTVDNIMSNPKLSYIITSVQNNPNLLNQLNIIVSNKNLLDTMSILINDIPLCNSIINIISTNKELFGHINSDNINVITKITQNPRLNTVLSNINPQFLPEILNVVEKCNNKPELIKEYQ